MDAMVMTIVPACVVAGAAATANAGAMVGYRAQHDLEFSTVLGQMAAQLRCAQDAAAMESEGASTPGEGASQCAAEDERVEHAQDDDGERREDAADSGSVAAQQITAMAAQESWISPAQTCSAMPMRERAATRPEGRVIARPDERTMPSADRPVAMQPAAERGRAAQPAADPVPADGVVASTQAKGEYTLPYERLAPGSEDAGYAQRTDDLAAAQPDEPTMAGPEGRAMARPAERTMPSSDRPVAMQPTVERGRTLYPEGPTEPMDGPVASAEVKRVHTLPPGERTMLISEDVDTVQLRDDHAAKLRAAAQPAERTIPSADRPVATQPTVERGRTAQQTEPAEPTGAARSMGNPVPADGAVASTEVKGEYTRPYERLTPASEDAGSVRVTDDRAVAELDRPATMQPAVEKGRTAQC